MFHNHCWLSIVFALACVPGSFAAEPPPDLIDYIKKEDHSFTWKLSNKTESGIGAVYELDLTSQTWHGIAWTHKLQIFVPKDAKPQQTMVLWNQGGRPGTSSTFLGLQIAEKVGAPVAFLYGVPSQPHFGGKREDALIAETFVQYLETKDSSWPLLFPMVKSIVRAMDTLQAFAKSEWKFTVSHFVVTGASKRGWTSWLTAASGDPRVQAIAPLVIDTLNFPVQMKNQLRAFGKPSEMVHDYVERKLIPIPNTPAAKKLWKMVDPWVYRDRITMPKMIINGTNDPYWPLDALNSYWGDLKGAKYVLYVPNAGHDLREKNKEGQKQLVPLRALNTLSEFCRCEVFNVKMPSLAWQNTSTDGGCHFQVKSDRPVAKLRVWVADAAARDFRQSFWSEQSADTVNPPEKGYRACVAEAEFHDGNRTFTLSSLIHILEAKK